ncbi:hypothetical protein CNMCM8980_001799 [Aspergillus fumigatiaffinis]|uniref:Cytochrome P450 monooxygenase n=1 Tax=Aspergillus fumigatiaffinis TaxID=340414 RepID=A0A8H4LZ70_9EURO|nr:hypothetical protein CNMCM5878_001410 [Aspergillus fumigatiaffinis]KAF4223076.1 hypothetical protein CNMCM6457_000776 [Aspergillus fumigatiaffinis]KAF4231091.1 hypothetical protein CNMCM6805_000323 [Aspergillus fumigatiaffinis]KAF4239224.1 hypothetical protein CNMCM8980_001799 [Aspergillus fumigatiaffinis]
MIKYMPGGMHLLFQVAVLSIVAFVGYAFRPNSWSNRVVSYVINKILLWWYPIHSIDGRTFIPTCPYRFPDGGGKIKFLEGETISRKWAERYGPIYRIWVGLTPEIIVTRPDDIKTAFKDSGNHRKAPNLNGGWVMGELVGDGVGLISQADWKRVHAVVSPPFAQRPITYVPLVQSRIDRHFAELSQSQDRKTMRLRPAEDIKLLPFWVISDLLYGELPQPMVEELLRITELRTDVFQYAFKGGLSLFSISRWFSPAIRNKLHVFHTRWAEFNRQAYHRAKASDAAAACAIVPLYTAVEEGRISRTELLHTLDEALFANIDVTIGSFSWIPPFLAAHADVQRELRDEITQARAQATVTPTGAAWVKYLASNTTLLASCINESARLKPVTNYTYAQSLPTGREVGGYLIPAGTYVVVDTNALNLRDPGWGSDRGEFRPRRFLEKPRGEFRYRLWRFGFGPRQCIAQALADTILKVLVAYMVENYQVKVPEKPTGGESEERKRGDAWFKVAEQEILLETL